MDSKTEVRISKKPQNVYKALADELLRLTRESVQPNFHIALSGGETPNGFFALLAEKYNETMPWERIHLWWGDERCVSPADDASNFKSANQKLISKVNIPKEQVHRIKGEITPELEALRYENEIKNHLNFRGQYPVFDLIILGLGNDGHTASIFPGRPGLFESERFYINTVHPETRQPRITLTIRAINNASLIFMLVTGSSKSKRVSEIMNDEEAARALPAYYLLPTNGKLIWFLDEEAASEIR